MCWESWEFFECDFRYLLQESGWGLRKQLPGITNHRGMSVGSLSPEQERRWATTEPESAVVCRADDDRA